MLERPQSPQDVSAKAQIRLNELAKANLKDYDAILKVGSSVKLTAVLDHQLCGVVCEHVCWIP